MTTWRAAMAVLRRWPFAMVGVVATVAAATGLLGRPGVYETSAEIHLIPPANTAATSIGGQNRATIAMAGLLEREINGFKEATPVAADVTLADMGLYDGARLQLPNSGGQWDYNFAQPLLQLSTTAPSAEAAASKRDALRDQVVTTLNALQAEHGIAPSSRITTRQVPADPPVTYDQGRPMIATAALLLLGLGLTATACVLLDRLLTERDRRRSHPLLDAAEVS